MHQPFLSALCSRTFNEHCLIFMQTKHSAHRLRIILGLLGLNVEELHGNLTQLQVCFKVFVFQARDQFKIRSDEGLTLEKSAFQIFLVGNSTNINSFDETKFSCFTLPLKQYHSFFRN